jgi:hypothetical protein
MRQLLTTRIVLIGLFIVTPTHADDPGVEPSDADRAEQKEEYDFSPPRLPEDQFPDPIPWGETYDGKRVACFTADGDAEFQIGEAVHVLILNNNPNDRVFPHLLTVLAEDGSPVPAIRHEAVGSGGVNSGYGAFCRVRLSSIYDLSVTGEYVVQYRVPTPDYLRRREAAFREMRRQRRAGEEIDIDWPEIEYGQESQQLRLTITE